MLAAIPIQTLVLTTGPPVVPPSTAQPALHRTTVASAVVFSVCLPCDCWPQHLDLDFDSASLCDYYAYLDTTTTTTRSLAGAAAKSKPTLSSSQVMHLALAPSLCILAFIPTSRVLSTVHTIPQ